MFRRRHFLDEDVDAFHIQCWGWLLRSTGGLDNFRQTPLVLPSPQFFPKTEEQGHDRATVIFEHVKRHAQMQDWPVELAPQADLPTQLSEFVYLKHEGTAAGTFSMHGQGGLVTYDPAHTSTPLVLIATFAHELGHYLNGEFAELPPGGADLVEPATDVTATFLGFGVFGANTAFEFHKNNDGWSSSRLGYITESEWAFDLAIFCALGEHDISVLKPYLKSHIFDQVKSGTKYLGKQAILEDILKLAASPEA